MKRMKIFLMILGTLAVLLIKSGFTEEIDWASFPSSKIPPFDERFFKDKALCERIYQTVKGWADEDRKSSEKTRKLLDEWVVKEYGSVGIKDWATFKKTEIGKNFGDTDADIETNRMQLERVMRKMGPQRFLCESSLKSYEEFKKEHLDSAIKEVPANPYDVYSSYLLTEYYNQHLEKNIEMARKTGRVAAGYLTEEEITLIQKTDYLFRVSKEQLRQICFEAARWSLAKIINLAEDSEIPYEVREKHHLIESKKEIESKPELKKFFHYDDVNLSLYGAFWMNKDIKETGVRYFCCSWPHVAYTYGYLKVKEPELREAAKAWGYSFDEFKSLVAMTLTYYIGEYVRAEPVPLGATVTLWPGFNPPGENPNCTLGKTDAYPTDDKIFFFLGGAGHNQLSLGPGMGYTTTSTAWLGVKYSSADSTTIWGKKTAWVWSIPIFINPIANSCWNWRRKGSVIERIPDYEIKSIEEMVKEGWQIGVFHLPKYRKHKEM